jgi:hypothetical protein
MRQSFKKQKQKKKKKRKRERLLIHPFIFLETQLVCGGLI